MEKKIRITRISHRGEWRFCVHFPFDKNLTEIVREINGALWSNTNRCWHVPGNEETLKQVLYELRGKADIDISSIVTADEMKRISSPPPSGDEEDLGVRIDDTLIIGRPQTTRKVTGKIDKNGILGPVRFSIRKNDGMLKIRFLGRYDKEWIQEMKTYGKLIYDPARKEWLLGWSQLTVDSLADYFTCRGVKVEVEKVDVSQKVREAREELGTLVREKILGTEVVSGIEKVRNYLLKKRYSGRTIESYISLLELFFKYYHDKDPQEITMEEISGFFNDFVITHNYSSSYQNQMVSAIKIYFMLNGSSEIDTSALARPRRVRALPKVFSKEEVKLILNSPRNSKHRLILWMIYSCGLRRSEITNIMLNDLDRDRSILNIREGKGMVDRIVPVSEKVWTKIDEYRDLYHPEIWLFEGQTGGRYSSESVYRIFKDALRRAGIKKEVGVHSLRHSYATHLHESGLDIRYIQELLGHRSTRTTEIYTHVSRRNLIAVRSPIEDMDIK